MIVLVVVILLVAAAVVIPVEFFVIRKQRVDREAQAALQQCETQLDCANGGTNVINQGTCSCICTNGFTGFDCSQSDSSGCTTIALTGETNINDVTIGSAIPRLLQQSERNFSIPLSSTEILAKLNAGNLSCSAMNALVTFDGESARQAAVPPVALGAAINGVVFTTVTVMVGQFTTVTLDAMGMPMTTTSSQRAVASPAVGSAGGNGDSGGFTTIITAPNSGTVGFATTITLNRSSAISTSTMMTTVSGTPLPSAAFIVSPEVLDFARVAVLYILQEENLNDAKTGQATLQQFFTSAAQGRSGSVSVERARNVTLGNGNSIDLVDFLVDTKSDDKIGKKPAVKARAPTAVPFPHLLRHR